MEDYKPTEAEIALLQERYVAPIIDKMKKCEDIGPLGDVIGMTFYNKALGVKFDISYNEWVRQNNEFDRMLIDYTNTYVAS
jgi:hypothetical protein